MTIRRGALVDDAAAVDHADHAADAQARDAGIPLDLDELCAEGVRGVLLGARICGQPAASSVAVGAGEIGSAEDLLVRNAAGGGLTFRVDAAVGHHQRACVLAL
jgi:hypothetical protein